MVLLRDKIAKIKREPSFFNYSNLALTIKAANQNNAPPREKNQQQLIFARFLIFFIIGTRVWQTSMRNSSTFVINQGYSNHLATRHLSHQCHLKHMHNTWPELDISRVNTNFKCFSEIVRAFWLVNWTGRILLCGQLKSKVICVVQLFRDLSPSVLYFYSIWKFKTFLLLNCV